MKEMTKANLSAAFAGESQAHMKYLTFADIAEREGFANVARLFRAASFAEQMLQSFNADLALIAAEGFTPEDGLTYSYEADATIARMMHERARKTIVLATARKLVQRDRITALRAGDVDTLVTGCGDDRTLARFADIGVDVVSAADRRADAPAGGLVLHRAKGPAESDLPAPRKARA